MQTLGVQQRFVPQPSGVDRRVCVDMVSAFPISRWALAEHAVLGLSETRVPGARSTLEAMGFLDRVSGAEWSATLQMIAANLPAAL